MSTILSQSPIKYNVLSKNQPIKNRNVTVVTKEEVPYTKRKFDNWLGKFNNYKSNDNNFLSLPCPAEVCNCGFFSNMFDSYDIGVKNRCY